MKQRCFVLNLVHVFFSSKALTYYTFNKSHLNSFILLVFPHVANFRYVANFTFLTLMDYCHWLSLGMCASVIY